MWGSSSPQARQEGKGGDEEGGQRGGRGIQRPIAPRDCDASDARVVVIHGLDDDLAFIVVREQAACTSCLLGLRELDMYDR